MKKILILIIILLSVPSLAQPVNVNPTPGDIWTYNGPTFGSGWAPIGNVQIPPPTATLRGGVKSLFPALPGQFFDSLDSTGAFSRSQALIPSNNLSDVAAPTTARGNLSAMARDASDVALPDARYNIGADNACNPVTDPPTNKADPTGVADSSAALIYCAAVTKNGLPVDTFLSSGIYRVNNQVALVGKRLLYGEDRRNTFIYVDQSFSSSASSVILLNDQGNQNNAPGVASLTFVFAQPIDQGTRANFLTLAQGCTSALGGTGCKYPPAIYVPQTISAVNNAGREEFYDIQCVSSWVCIQSDAASGIRANRIYDSSLSIGVALANGHDFGHLNTYEHHNGFGLCGGQVVSFITYNAATCNTGLNAVYYDGSTFAASIGSTDGMQFGDWHIWSSRIALTADFSWGTFSNLKLDGDNSTLEVAATSNNAAGLTINGGYNTGSPSGANTHCAIDLAAGAARVTITGWNGNGAAKPSICNAGATLTVTGSFFTPLTGGVSAITQSNGQMNLTGNTFRSNNTIDFSAAPMIAITGGSFVVSDNMNVDPPKGGTSPSFLTSSVDASGNIFSDNSLATWAFSPPGTAGCYDAAGSWTPVMTFGGASTGITYSLRDGKWRLKCHQFTAEFTMILSAVGSATGNAIITGLPYAPSGNFNPACTITFYSALASITGGFASYVPSGVTGCSLWQNGAANHVALTEANFTNTSNIQGSISILIP